jgi:hypothetical protein
MRQTQAHGSGGGWPTASSAGLTVDQLATWSAPGPQANDRLLSRSFHGLLLPPAFQVAAGSLSPECTVLPLDQARSGTDVAHAGSLVRRR